MSNEALPRTPACPPVQFSHQLCSCVCLLTVSVSVYPSSVEARVTKDTVVSLPMTFGRLSFPSRQVQLESQSQHDFSARWTHQVTLMSTLTSDSWESGDQAIFMHLVFHLLSCAVVSDR